MSAPKVLVVYYSRTGTTEKLARYVAAEAGADLEALADTVNRKGFLGFMRSIADAARQKGTTLEPMHVDPGAYDLVIVGTPDWGRSVSSPVRTFLVENRDRLHDVAFFLTDGRADHAAVFRDMARLAGKEPVATLGVPHDDVEKGFFAEEATGFVRSLHPAAAA